MRPSDFAIILRWHQCQNAVLADELGDPQQKASAEEFGRFLESLTPEDVSGVDERIKREIAEGTARRAREDQNTEQAGAEQKGLRRQA